MPRHLFFVFVLLFCLYGHTSESEADVGATNLTLLTWPDYFDPDVLASFEQSHNAKVQQIYFDSEEVRNKLITLDLDGRYDIAIVSHDNIENYVNAGWVATLETGSIPNLKYMDPRFDIAGVTGKYTVVPFFEGYSGIVYRTDLVPQKIESWQQMFGFDPALKGKILMVDDPTELIATAHVMLDIPLPEISADIPLAVKEVLRKQKQNLHSYNFTNSDPENSLLLTGTISAAYTYTGDALLLMDQDPKVDFVIPKEGCLIFRDYFVLFKASKNQKLASAFLNHIADIEQAVKSTRYSGYATPHIQVMGHLSEEEKKKKSDYVHFPEPETLARCRLIPRPTPEQYKAWSMFKQQLLDGQ